MKTAMILFIRKDSSEYKVHNEELQAEYFEQLVDLIHLIQEEEGYTDWMIRKSELADWYENEEAETCGVTMDDIMGWIDDDPDEEFLLCENWE